MLVDGMFRGDGNRQAGLAGVAGAKEKKVITGAQFQHELVDDIFVFRANRMRPTKYILSGRHSGL